MPMSWQCRDASGGCADFGWKRRVARWAGRHAREIGMPSMLGGIDTVVRW